MWLTSSKQNGAQLHPRESATFAYCQTVMQNSPIPRPKLRRKMDQFLYGLFIFPANEKVKNSRFVNCSTS